ncbi:MAG: HEPN domain-containing protein [Phycisphaerae bacterium]|nr:HEPN domain-containing protein [Phycisphaerae bacterium]
MAETRAWLAKARGDLRMARIARDAHPPLLDQAVYHAQQSAEKAMKGFLTFHNRPFRKTHNLVEIGGGCTAIDATLDTLFGRAAVLTEYGWRYRYPGEPDEPTLDETEEAIQLADAVLSAVMERLPEETN